MFRPSCRSSSPYPFRDLDMWDTKSHFSSQTSAWYGTETVSGSGYLSKVNTSSLGSAGGYRLNDPGPRKWQSLSHLAPEGAARPFAPSPAAEVHASRGRSSFRQTEVAQWLQDAQESIDTQLRTRDAHLSYNTMTAKLLDMKHKLSDGGSHHEQEKEAAELPLFERNFQRRELQEKMMKLERDLLHMRSTLDTDISGRPSGKPPGKTLTVSEEEFNRQTSQVEEMNRRLSDTMSHHSEVQEQLREANNKISQSCLDKATLSTQVLKLEEEVKHLRSKLTEAHLIQEKADLQLRAHAPEKTPKPGPEVRDQEKGGEQPTALKEVNEKLTRELGAMEQKLSASERQLHELMNERVVNTKLIRDLEAERSELIRQEEELLSKINTGGREMKKCCQLRDFVEGLESEKGKLQDRCLRLEAQVLESEEKLQLLKEEHLKRDAGRVKNIEELRAVTSHWTEKWQKAALTLQITQEKLDQLSRNNPRSERDCDSLLRVELDACKQELELERSRSQSLLHRHKHAGAEATPTKDKGTVTDLSESSSSPRPPPDSHSSQNKSSQALIEKNEVQTLKEKLAHREKELQEKEHALQSLRVAEKQEVSASELQTSEDYTDQANVSTCDSLRAQLEESQRTVNQLQEEKLLAVQKIQALKQLYPIPVDRWSCQQSPGLMPVFEEDEESEGSTEEAGAEETLHDQEHEMSAKSAEISTLGANNHNLLQALRFKQPMQHLPSAADTQSDTEVQYSGDQQQRSSSLFPDGVFLAVPVDVCSPDEDEEEG